MAASPRIDTTSVHFPTREVFNIDPIDSLEHIRNLSLHLFPSNSHYVPAQTLVNAATGGFAVYDDIKHVKLKMKDDKKDNDEKLLTSLVMMDNLFQNHLNNILCKCRRASKPTLRSIHQDLITIRDRINSMSASKNPYRLERRSETVSCLFKISYSKDDGSRKRYLDRIVNTLNSTITTLGTRVGRGIGSDTREEPSLTQRLFEQAASAIVDRIEGAMS